MALTDVLPHDESIFEDKEHVEFLQVVSNELSSTSTARLWIWSREGQDWIERVKNAIQLKDDYAPRLLQAVLKRHFLSLQARAQERGGANGRSCISNGGTGDAPNANHAPRHQANER